MEDKVQDLKEEKPNKIEAKGDQEEDTTKMMIDQ